MAELCHDNGGIADECLGCGKPWDLAAGHMPCPSPAQASGWPQPVTREELERLKSRRRDFILADEAWPPGETGALAEARERALAAYQVELEILAWRLIGHAERTLDESDEASFFLRTHGDALAFGLALTTGSDAETVSEERRQNAFAAVKALGEATRP